jgi:SAM-dependent methyltransferase
MGIGVEFEYLNDAQFIVDECKDCGLIYQREIPSDFLMGRIYQEWLNADIIKKNIANNCNADHYMRMAKETTRSIKYLKKSPGQIKFLDFGMGAGNWCLMAKAFGCDTYGTDLSSEHMADAEELGIKTINMQDLKKHSFDYINSEQVFEHLAEPLEALKYLSEALAPGGIIRINVPSGWDVKRRLEVWDWHASLSQEHPDTLNDVAPLQHINCFTKKPLIHMGEAAGLELINVPSFPNKQGNSGICEKIKNTLYPIYNLLTLGQKERRKEQNIQKITNVFYTKR